MFGWLNLDMISASRRKSPVSLFVRKLPSFLRSVKIFKHINAWDEMTEFRTYISAVL